MYAGGPHALKVFSTQVKPFRSGTVRCLIGKEAMGGRNSLGGEATIWPRGSSQESTRAGWAGRGGVGTVVEGRELGALSELEGLVTSPIPISTGCLRGGTKKRRRPNRVVVFFPSAEI
jgi:hypothetical protein